MVTTCFTDTVGRGHPQVSRSSVKHHSKVLLWSSQTDLPIVLCLHNTSYDAKKQANIQSNNPAFKCWMYFLIHCQFLGGKL